MTLKKELWYQDSVGSNLWVNEQGLIVNTAALNERAPYYDVVRVLQQPLLAQGYEAISVCA